MVLKQQHGRCYNTRKASMYVICLHCIGWTSWIVSHQGDTTGILYIAGMCCNNLYWMKRTKYTFFAATRLWMFIFSPHQPISTKTSGLFGSSDSDLLFSVPLFSRCKTKQIHKNKYKNRETGTLQWLFDAFTWVFASKPFDCSILLKLKWIMFGSWDIFR